MSSKAGSFKELALNQEGLYGIANVLIHLQMRTTSQIGRMRTMLSKAGQEFSFCKSPDRRKAHSYESPA